MVLDLQDLVCTCFLMFQPQNQTLSCCVVDPEGEKPLFSEEQTKKHAVTNRSADVSIYHSPPANRGSTSPQEGLIFINNPKPS